MNHLEYGYFNVYFLFLVILLLPVSSGEGIDLRYFISKNEIMMLKCEIPDDFCCSDINKIEFFKNGEGVCTFKDCQPFFDVPLRREDTQFYRCGCSVNNIRKTHLITTELRKTDYGNWSCACSCGDATCRSNTISILPTDYDEENDPGIKLTYFISKNGIMVLKCEIPDDFCCSDINKIEFFKNGDGVCTFQDCLPFFDVPLDREHTRFYRCGCSVNNIRKTHLITTELRKTDYGNWSCACSCGDVTCRGDTISILPPDSQKENDRGVDLRYFISKNEIMMLKCEISDDFCCSDINKIEFFKNGRGVCTFRDCQPFFDVPLHREDTQFYRCGCSVNNIRKTHLITTELRKTDYGNWSCACSCGDVTCRGDTISILPPDSQKENDRGINLRYFNSKNEVMVLKCEIPDDFCCSDINKIEFFKNGDGVCTFKNCRPFFDVPLYREDTRFYRCGCSVNNIRKTHLITMELRKTDYGNWSCACSCGDVTCRGDTISILPPDSHEKNVSLVYIHDQEKSVDGISPVFTHEAEAKLFTCWVVSIVIVLVIIIGMFLGILFVGRCYISLRVTIVHENWLTRLCLGRVQKRKR